MEYIGEIGRPGLREIAGDCDPAVSGVYRRKLAAVRPDFLIISPPKTGSTWLADNFRCHPGIFVPDVKEVKYFSYFCEWLDLDWYLDHFRSARGRLLGEASPSYAILPIDRIRWIRHILPDVKLIYLMRDPVGRAWSHARHCCRFGEANFSERSAKIEAITESQWRENFVHDWPLANGDYLSQLQRWLSVFPREQFFIGFYESIASDPEALLHDLFTFLGADANVDYSAFRVKERIFAGLSKELPHRQKQFLQELLHNRTQELAEFLRNRFGLELPSEWAASCLPADGSAAESRDCHGAPISPMDERRRTLQATDSFDRVDGGSGDVHDVRRKPAEAGRLGAFRSQCDDRRLLDILERVEENSVSLVQIATDYAGYNVLFYRGAFYAIQKDLNFTCIEQQDSMKLDPCRADGQCFVASNLCAVKDQIKLHLLARVETQAETIARLQASLHEMGEYIACLEQRLGESVATFQTLRGDLGKLEQETKPYRSFYRMVGRIDKRLRSAWDTGLRRLKEILGRTGDRTRR
jgi:hypothetical protein